MGQYYNIIIKPQGQKKVYAYDRAIDGEYTMAKLTEHSWYLNPMVNAIAEKLYYSPSKIAWVGDYAKETEEETKLWKHAYGEKGHKKTYEMLHKTQFNLNGKYIVNHTKKLYLDCWQFLVDSIRQNPNAEYCDWVLNPLPLLVAVGNGRGGGDYAGINKDKIGCWAWDTLEIVEYETLKDYKGFQEFKVLFIEE